MCIWMNLFNYSYFTFDITKQCMTLLSLWTEYMDVDGEIQGGEEDARDQPCKVKDNDEDDECQEDGDRKMEVRVKHKVLNVLFGGSGYL